MFKLVHVATGDWLQPLIVLELHNFIFSKLIWSSSEAVAQRCSVEKMFLEFLKIHRKTPVLESLI